MCLYVGNKVALVAKKDIVVLKYLEKKGDSYVTPCQETPVELNKVFKPTEVDNLFEENYNKFTINGGVIHACLDTENSFSCACFKAIIKAGTEYYIQDDFKQVAAKEIFITDEEIKGDFTTPDMKSICEDYLNAIRTTEGYVGKDGVCVGDYCLSDKSFVNPLSDFDHSKAIGIVAYINEDGVPVIVALEQKNLPWLTQYTLKNNVCSNIDYKDTVNDFNGKQHTKDIVSSKEYDPEKYKAVEYCVNYVTEGTEKGDWYMPAIGECVKMAQNFSIINAAVIYTGVGTKVDYDWMWSSSESVCGAAPYVWYCFLSLGGCHNTHNNLGLRSLVCPFAAFIN